MKKINGQDISTLSTLGSWYDNQCIAGKATINGKDVSFRMGINEVTKMLGDFNFNVDFGENDKRRKHIYLEVDDSVYNDDQEVTDETKELLDREV